MQEMQKWEYLILSNFTSELEKFRIITEDRLEFKTVLDDEELIKLLTELGNEGWEMFSHVIHENWNQRYIFKRPKKENDEE